MVLVGVSRTSKTPTSIYLANRGVKVANVPVVPDCPLPSELDTLSGPLVVGLTISPEPLVQIRMNRLRQLHLENARRKSAAVRGRLCRAGARASGADSCAATVCAAWLAGDRRDTALGRGDRSSDLSAPAGAPGPPLDAGHPGRGDPDDGLQHVRRHAASSPAPDAMAHGALSVRPSSRARRWRLRLPGRCVDGSGALGAARGGSGAVPARESRAARSACASSTSARRRPKPPSRTCANATPPTSPSTRRQICSNRSAPSLVPAWRRSGWRS